MAVCGETLIVIALAGAAQAASPVAVPIAPGRTTTIVVREDVGAPLERAVPSATYARAAAADADARWDDARLLYRRAADEWSMQAHARPSPALDAAIAKAGHEAQASQALANRARNPAFPSGPLPAAARLAIRHRQALEDGRLLRAKMMAVRAALGRTPAALYARAAGRLEDARDAVAAARGEIDPEIQLLLCATYAVGGDVAAAARARLLVSEAARQDPVHTLARAACAAALGENDDARAALESYVLLPILPHPETLLRDVYLANDWDHLRGDPRFETLFR